MHKKRGGSPYSLRLLLGFCILAVLLAGVQVAAGDEDVAIIENKGSEGIVLKYDEILAGNPAETIRDVFPGEVLRVDPAKIDGEVCAYRAADLELPEKIGCRTLAAGDRWVIE
jgi:hypothetical protein